MTRTRPARWAPALLSAATALFAFGSARAAPLAPASPTPWWVPPGTEARLPAERGLDLLRRFVEPWVERPGEWRSFWTGRYGPGNPSPSFRLAWNLNSCEPAVEAHELAPLPLDADEWELAPVSLPRAPHISAFDLIPTWRLDATPAPNPALFAAATAPRCKPWQRAYGVTVARYGGEHDSFELLECDGSVAIDALDRLSVIARPPETARPELPLPLEPDPESGVSGEWVPNVRMLDPRLLWVLARISEAYPNHVVYVISGYRRDGHTSYHKKGRALDLFVMGVSNEDVFKLCHSLKDVGCGYYPNNKFVHVDVRPPNTGHALWIDVSRPGEPSHYVDSWPGIVASGALLWSDGE